MRASIPGELVVGVPARDVVIVTGSQSAPGLEKARRAVDRVFFAGDDNLLTRRLLVRRGGMWEPFDGAARPAGGRPAPHSGDQRPRQYQDHPSWPGERVPIAAMRPISPVDRTAPPQRRPMPARPLAPAASGPPGPAGPPAGVGPLGPAGLPGPLAAAGPLAGAAMPPMSPAAMNPPVPPARPGPPGPALAQPAYHTGDIPRPVPFGQPTRSGPPQPSYAPAKPTYRDEERGYPPARPERDYGQPGHHAQPAPRPVPAQPSGPAHPVSAVPQGLPGSARVEVGLVGGRAHLLGVPVLGRARAPVCGAVLSRPLPAAPYWLPPTRPLLPVGAVPVGPAPGPRPGPPCPLGRALLGGAVLSFPLFGRPVPSGRALPDRQLPRSAVLSAVVPVNRADLSGLLGSQPRLSPGPPRLGRPHRCPGAFLPLVAGRQVRRQPAVQLSEELLAGGAGDSVRSCRPPSMRARRDLPGPARGPPGDVRRR